jgi:hypothetical protein
VRLSPPEAGDGLSLFAQRHRETLFDDERRVDGLDRLGDEEGEVALEADVGLEQVVHEALVVLDVGGGDLEDVVEAAADGPALDDLGASCIAASKRWKSAARWFSSSACTKTTVRGPKISGFRRAPYPVITPAVSSLFRRSQQGVGERLTRLASSVLEMRPSRWRMARILMSRSSSRNESFIVGALSLRRRT